MRRYKGILLTGILAVACVIGCLSLGGWTQAKSSTIADMLSGTLGAQSSSSADSAATGSSVDSDGNVTVSGILGLGGEDLANLLKTQGYTYDSSSSSDTYGYFVSKGSQLIIAQDATADTGMSDSDIAALGKSTVDPAMVVMDFPSTMVAKDWLAEQGLTVSKSTYKDTGCFAIIDVDSTEYLLMVYPSVTFPDMMEAAVLNDDGCKAVLGSGVEDAYDELVSAVSGSAEGTGEQVDADGNVTLSAILTSNGQDLSDLLTAQGYKYDSTSADDTYGFFIKGEDSALALISDVAANEGMSDDDLAASGSKLPGIVCAIMMEPSSDMPEAWLATQGVTIVDSTTASGVCLAIIQAGESEYLVMATSASSSSATSTSLSATSSSASASASASDSASASGSASGSASSSASGSASASASGSAAADTGMMEVYVLSDDACQSVYNMSAQEAYDSLAGLANGQTASDVDSNGDVSLSAIFGLSGQDLADLFTQQGYTYDSSTSFFSKSDTTGVELIENVSDDNALDDQTLAALGDTAVSPCFVAMTIPTSSEFGDWLADQGVTIVEKTDFGSEGYLAIIEVGDDAAKYIVQITASTTVKGSGDVLIFDDDTCQALYGADIESVYESAISSGSSSSSSSTETA